MQPTTTTPAAILIVEDDPMMLQILTSVLRKHLPTAEIIAVSTGRRALDQLAQRPIPLLVTDYNLPGISGLQLARIVKTQRPGTCVVLMSGETLDSVMPGIDYYDKVLGSFTIWRRAGLLDTTLL